MRTKIKNILFIVTIFSLSCLSCKKNSSNTDIPIGTISVNIDGTATTFNYVAKVSALTVMGGYGIKIQGYKRDPSASATNLMITVIRPTPITTGTYVENAGSNPLVKMDYTYDAILSSTASAHGSTTKPVTITITEITSAYVKGTFSGEIQFTTYGIVNTGLTNGAFYVSY